MNKLYLKTNFAEEFKVYECENICEELSRHFETFPQSAVIIHNDLDVTPKTPEDVERLMGLKGDFYCTVYPQAPVLPFIGMLVLAVGAAILLKPKIPKHDLQDADNGSRRNTLQSLQNKQRLGGRIPYIFGKCRVAPDLISLPLKFYKNGNEYEYSFMCAGANADYVKFETLFKGEFDSSESEHLKSKVFWNRNGGFSQIAQFGNQKESWIIENLNLENYYAKELDTFSGKLLKADTSTVIRDIALDIPETGRQYIDRFNKFTSNNNHAKFIKFINNKVSIYEGGSFKNWLDMTRYFTNDDYLEIFAENEAVSSSSNLHFKYPFISVEHEDIVFYDTAGQYIGTNNLVYVKEFSGDFKTKFWDLVKSGLNEVVTKQSYVQISKNEYLKIKAGQILKIKAFERKYTTRVRIGKDSEVDLKGTEYEVRISNVEFERVNTSPNPSEKYLDSIISVLRQKENTRIETGIFKIKNVTRDYAELYDVNFGEIERFSSKSPVIRYGLKRSNKNDSFASNGNNSNIVLVNLIAPNGLYKINDNGKQESASVDIEIQYNTPSEIKTKTVTIVGSSRDRSKTGITILIKEDETINFISILRKTPEITARSGVSQDIKIEAVYTLHTFNPNELPEAFYVRHLETIDKHSSYGSSMRLNFKVYEKNYEFYENQLAGFLTSIHGGKLKNSQLPLILNKNGQEFARRFRNNEVLTLNYASDEANISIEEFLQASGRICLFQPFRQSNRIEYLADFEKDVPTMLFNHRNIMPNTFKCTYKFGVENDYDGVSVEYTTVESLEPRYVKIPNSLSKKYKEIKFKGIGSLEQAKLVGWRIWHEMTMNNKFIEFEATPEANIVSVGSLIIAPTEIGTSNTLISSGEILEISGLKLKLSQQIENLKAGQNLVILIQHYNGTVESVAGTATNGTDEFNLSKSLSASLTINKDSFSRPTYWIVPDSDVKLSLFKVVEKIPTQDMKVKISAVEYDRNVYSKDNEFLGTA